MAEISTELCGLRLDSPVMLASGILGETAPSILRALRAGAGAAITKSIGKAPRDGYPNPTVVETEAGLINAVGLANPGIDEFLTELDEAITGQPQGPVIGSIFAPTPGEFSALAKKMAEGGASAVELNLGCPHAKGLGSEIGQDPVLVREITSAVKKGVDIPVLVKITPNVTDIVEIASAVEKGGGDAVVAINTVRAMAIDADMARPVLHNKLGGMSGPAIRGIGLAAVWRTFEKVDVPIVGVGGISRGRDVVEYLMAGARAVQIGTAVWSHGLEVFRMINDEISYFMDTNGYSRIEDLVGVAHRA